MWRNGGGGGGYTSWAMVTLRRRDKVLTVPAGRNLERILREAGIIPDTVLVVRDGKIVPLDYRPQDGEEFELIDVISGG
ncbi:MAG: MoaD/ThiS family protein [Candidatus Bipolaricaulaceae bacterium]